MYQVIKCLFGAFGLRLRNARADRCRDGEQNQKDKQSQPMDRAHVIRIRVAWPARIVTIGLPDQARRQLLGIIPGRDVTDQGLLLT